MGLFSKKSSAVSKKNADPHMVAQKGFEDDYNRTLSRMAVLHAKME